MSAVAGALSPAEALAYKVVSWGIAAAYLIGLPALARRHWDDLRLWVGNDDHLTHIGTWLVNVLLTLVSNLLLAGVYACRVPALERFRISGKPWPWFSADPAVRDAFWSFLPQAVGLVAFNNFCVALPLALLVGGRLPHAPTLASELPGTGKMLWQVAFCMLVEDFVFYWCHRLLHHRSLYPHVHKIHHKFHQSWAIASEFAHPLEFVIGNIVPVVAGPRLLAVGHALTGKWDLLPHTFTIWMWMGIRIATSIDNHCGYAFPWSPVRLLPGWLGLSTQAHDFHHSHNVGLYGSQFWLWDAMMGTDRQFKAWEQGRTAVQSATHEADADGEGSTAKVKAKAQ